MKRNVVVAALGTTQTLAWGSSYYLPAILAEPIAEGLGLSRSMVFGVFSGSLLVSAFLGPAVGRAIDNRGGRGVLVLSNLVLAAGLIVLALAQGLVSLAAAWAVLGVGMALGLYDSAFATLAGLYGREARGPITGITLIAGFASTIGWPLSALLDASLGWRGACLTLGCTSSADRATAKPASHSARAAARARGPAGRNCAGCTARRDGDNGLCVRRDLVCYRGNGCAHAASARDRRREFDGRNSRRSTRRPRSSRGAVGRVWRPASGSPGGLSPDRGGTASAGCGNSGGLRCAGDHDFRAVPRGRKRLIDDRQGNAAAGDFRAGRLWAAYWGSRRTGTRSAGGVAADFRTSDRLAWRGGGCYFFGSEYCSSACLNGTQSAHLAWGSAVKGIASRF